MLFQHNPIVGQHSQMGADHLFRDCFWCYCRSYFQSLMLMLAFKSWLRNLLPWDYAKRGRAIRGRPRAWSRYLAEASRNHFPPRLFVIFGVLKREYFEANASFRTQVLSQGDTHFCTLAHLDNLWANNFQNMDIDIPFKLFCHCRVINAYMHIHFLYFSLQYIFEPLVGSL